MLMIMTRRQVVAALIALAAFGVLLVLVAAGWDPLQRLDTRIDDDLNGWFAAHHETLRWSRRISAAGQPLTFQVLAVVTAGLLWFAGRVRDALFVAIAVLGAGVLSNLVKAIVDRDRPTVPVHLADAAASSFPSGHALTSAVALGVFVVVSATLLGRGWRVALVALGAIAVAAIGFSRLALGVHYPSDVLAAWLLGTAWVLVSASVRFVTRPSPG